MAAEAPLPETPQQALARAAQDARLSNKGGHVLANISRSKPVSFGDLALLFEDIYSSQPDADKSLKTFSAVFAKIQFAGNMETMAGKLWGLLPKKLLGRAAKIMPPGNNLTDTENVLYTSIQIDQVMRNARTAEISLKAADFVNAVRIPIATFFGLVEAVHQELIHRPRAGIVVGSALVATAVAAPFVSREVLSQVNPLLAMTIEAPIISAAILALGTGVIALTEYIPQTWKKYRP